ncbi:MAG: GGDEF domain-containing protein [Hylemonella sp.]|nr:GGDEF domain-containing protein [Hylemonella sp.]
MKLVTAYKSRALLAYALIMVFLASVIGFWAWELDQSLKALESRRQKHLTEHQQRVLDAKSKELKSLFHELFQGTRTISLLPMVRNVAGGNRRSAQEDVVASGRLSIDTHRTLRQIYANLAFNVRVSEVYYVLDGFDPDRDVPFFMYDEHITEESDGAASPQAPRNADIPEESEEAEYQQFPVQLAWFRKHEPVFRWSSDFSNIPVRLSPLLRTCDNSQYLSKSSGDVRETYGFVYAMPVYDQGTQRFKGMITTIVRANLIEAALIGVPYLPLTREDQVRQQQQGWSLPAPVSFVLEQSEYGIRIGDRRFALASSPSADHQAQTARLTLALETGRPWTLTHTLTASEIVALSSPFKSEYQNALSTRLAALFVMLMLTSTAAVLLRRAQNELATQARTDGLTLLPNRRSCFEHLEHAILRAHRSQRKIGLLFMNIQDFKSINDTYGHHGGDTLLASIGQRLKQLMRDEDIINQLPEEARNAGKTTASRLGGDEFVIFFEDLQRVEDAAMVANRVVNTMKRPFDIDGNQVFIRAGMGVAI